MVNVDIFSHIIGNSHAKQTLSIWAQSSAVPQVLLFHGPQGIGKGLFALQLAQALLKSSRAQHPDLHVVHPDPESDQHPIASLRQIIHETSLPPFEAPCKVFIIHDVEKMVATSSNTLLKTLEEPPADTQFILLTSQASMLLPTIVSRCSKVPFYHISDEELTQFLQEKHRSPEAKKIALLSEGSIAKALVRLADPKPLLPVDELFSCRGYSELHHLLHPLTDDFTSLETDRLFEEMLYWIREHDPLRLQDALPLISEARTALYHHIKLKTVLERFFLLFRIAPLG